MAVTGFYKVIKYILVAFNILVLIAGAIAIGLGAWGLGSEYGANQLKALTGSEIYRGAAIAIIVGGSVLVFLALLGALGAFLENRVLLAIYFTILLLILILFVVAAAVGFAFRDELGEKIDKQMTETLQNRYGHDIYNNNGNDAITDVWDTIQQKLDCCGVSGGVSSNRSWFIYQSTKWFAEDRRNLTQYVPRSCCTDNVDSAECQNLNSDPQKPPQRSPVAVKINNMRMHHLGCLDSLEDMIFEHIVAIAGISIAILIVLFLCILLSICLCAQIGRVHKE